ncbi:radical SAM protein [Candidatus Woesearchaeota archaeon]|jgi:MoaA/NifB/PqqE/SkfB family radical SAM enzyme|nr:radical SAM protein [Candidatus Woesearchaeota archaeon]MBT3538442.1 radical SAM protein [Candidatus Woesearchaeota archaeon]MBT7106102.1 radical SAM protein [Candidatus Woesearchaeota archaeon]MBT7931000.1 radical SAM protein [Candidatus Woesearchaeota archaeon]
MQKEKNEYFDESHLERSMLKNMIPLDIPLCVYVDLTNICNFTCPWCPTGNGLQTKYCENNGIMNSSIFSKTISDMKEFTTKKKKKIKVLGLFMMGEPFLNKNCINMIKIAKEASVAETLLLTTNGSLLSKDLAPEILDSGLDTMVISMYGESNEDYRKVSESCSFDKVLENAKMLLDLREQRGMDTPKICLKFFKNSEKIEGLRDRLMNCCDKIIFEEPFNWNEHYTKKTGNFISPSKESHIKYCSQPWYVMSIVWDGSVLVCCSDYMWKTIVGNIKNESLLNIWEGEGYLSFRRRIVEGRQNENLACKGYTFCYITDQRNNIDEVIINNPEKALGLKNT